MLRIVVLVAIVVSSSSCKDKEASKTKAEDPVTGTSATPEQAPVAPTSVDEAQSKRCSQAIAKVAMDDFMAAASDGKPSPGEQAIIDGVRKQSQAACEAEGLTEEQAACFDSIKDLETLFFAADCPALAAKRPSWFKVPPPEVRKTTLEQMKNRQDAAPGEQDH